MKIRAIESSVFEYEAVCDACGELIAKITIILNDEGAETIIRLPDYGICMNPIDFPRYDNINHNYYDDSELISQVMEYCDEDFIRWTVDDILEYEAGGIYEN